MNVEIEGKINMLLNVNQIEKCNKAFNGAALPTRLKTLLALLDQKYAGRIEITNIWQGIGYPKDTMQIEGYVTLWGKRRALRIWAQDDSRQNKGISWWANIDSSIKKVRLFAVGAWNENDSV